VSAKRRADPLLEIGAVTDGPRRTLHGRPRRATQEAKPDFTRIRVSDIPHAGEATPRELDARRPRRRIPSRSLTRGRAAFEPDALSRATTANIAQRAGRRFSTKIASPVAAMCSRAPRSAPERAQMRNRPRK
jgi:hypothetical protein